MTSQTKKLNLELIFEEMSYYSVESVFFDSVASCLRIHFGASVEGQPNAAIVLFNPTLCLFSKILHDEFPFIVGEISLVALDDGGKNILSKLGYAFRECEEVAFYPSQNLYHFHLEGGLCVEAVCTGYEILRGV